MDLVYLTGQQPADVHAIGRINIAGIYLALQQGKTYERLSIQLEVDGVIERAYRRVGATASSIK